MPRNDLAGCDINLKVVGMRSRKRVENFDVEIFLSEESDALVLLVEPIKTDLSKRYRHFCTFDANLPRIVQLPGINIGELKVADDDVVDRQGQSEGDSRDAEGEGKREEDARVAG
jgi:hypothetical protein